MYCIVASRRRGQPFLCVQRTRTTDALDSSGMVATVDCSGIIGGNTDIHSAFPPLFYHQEA